MGLDTSLHEFWGWNIWKRTNTLSGDGGIAMLVTPAGQDSVQYYMHNASAQWKPSVTIRDGVARYYVGASLVRSIEMNSLSGKYSPMVSLQPGEKLRGFMTSAAPCLLLNTDELEPGVPYHLSTPDTGRYSGITGPLLRVDVSKGIWSSDHILEFPASDSVRGCLVRFNLDQAGVRNVRLINGANSYTLDSAFYRAIAPNVLKFYDAPATSVSLERVPFFLDLEDQLMMTPNGDGAYDLFQIGGYEAQAAFQLTIKDRTGALLYQSNDPSRGWNGRYMNSGSVVPDGVYVYELELDGTPYQGQFMLKN
jgi:gliding motility-associated-like protein